MLLSVCPIMPSRDFDETIAFYDRLGFDIASRWEDEGYLILERAEVELHFFAHPGHEPQSCDHGAYVRVRDLDRLAREYDGVELPRAGIPRYAPLEEKPWGMRELAVIDIDGNLVRFGMPLKGWAPERIPGQAAGGGEPEAGDG